MTTDPGPTPTPVSSAASAPAAYSTDGVREVVAGTVLWVIALIVSLALHSTLREHGYLWFVPTGAVGAGLGVVGVLYCRRRAAIIRSGGRADLF